MKKIIILTLILMLNQGSASAYSDKPVNKLLSEAMEYELNNIPT